MASIYKTLQSIPKWQCCIMWREQKKKTKTKRKAKIKSVNGNNLTYFIAWAFGFLFADLLHTMAAAEPKAGESSHSHRTQGAECSDIKCLISALSIRHCEQQREQQWTSKISSRSRFQIKFNKCNCVQQPKSNKNYKWQINKMRQLWETRGQGEERGGGYKEEDTVWQGGYAKQKCGTQQMIANSCRLLQK